jgi:mono/diheme cytochrome c family protein
MRKIGFLALFSCLSALAILPASAQTAGDPGRGRDLARQWCAACHIVAQGDGRSATDAVPTFMSIAARPSTTALGLRAFLQTPHLRMPDFALSADQTDDTIAYIMSLRR